MIRLHSRQNARGDGGFMYRTRVAPPFSRYIYKEAATLRVDYTPKIAFQRVVFTGTIHRRWKKSPPTCVGPKKGQPGTVYRTLHWRLYHVGALLELPPFVITNARRQDERMYVETTPVCFFAPRILRGTGVTYQRVF